MIIQAQARRRVIRTVANWPSDFGPGDFGPGPRSQMFDAA